MTSEEIKNKKSLLRSNMKSKLNSMGRNDKIRASEQICKEITLWIIEHPEVKTIACFAPLSSEPNLSSLVSELSHLNWVFPHSLPNGQMSFHQVDSVKSLEPGLYGILQPNPTKHSLIPPLDIDCFLCPALAFTTAGARLGKGGGYYDRILARRNPNSHILGVCFSLQLLESIPTEAHDTAAHSVIHA